MICSFMFATLASILAAGDWALGCQFMRPVVEEYYSFTQGALRPSDFHVL